MFSIGDLTHVWLVANVREMDAPQVHVGDAVEVRVLSGTDLKVIVNATGYSEADMTNLIPAAHGSDS